MGWGRRNVGGIKPFDLLILLLAYKFLALNRYLILFSPFKNFLNLLCPILATLYLHMPHAPHYYESLLAPILASTFFLPIPDTSMSTCQPILHVATSQIIFIPILSFKNL